MPALRAVCFSMCYFQHEPERYAAFVPYIQAHLPRAFDAGLIAFSYRSSFLHPMDRFVEE